MSEELLGDVDICSGSWWSSMRCGGNDLLPPWAPAATEMVDGNACRPFDDSPASCITFQEQPSHNPQLSDDQIASTPFMDSVLSHPSVDWSQSIIDESCGSSLQAMFQEVSTSKPHHVQGYGEPWHDPLKDISHGFFVDPRFPESTVSSDILLISSFGFQQESPAGGETRPSSLRTWPLQFARTSIEEKPGNPQAVKYCNSEAARDSSYYSSVLKKPRIEAPSPLPTFKVRKEKLGDRVTALQQLVSPFGKTDTGSVLYEAIEYIKFLHEQVRAQSSPYLPNDSKMNHQMDSERMNGDESPRRDLRSQGLCLVPISTTFAVTAGGFWSPAFGGSYIYRQ